MISTLEDQIRKENPNSKALRENIQKNSVKVSATFVRKSTKFDAYSFNDPQFSFRGGSSHRTDAQNMLVTDRKREPDLSVQAQSYKCSFKFQPDIKKTLEAKAQKNHHITLDFGNK